MDLYSYYQDLYKLTKKQKECIEERDFDQLLEVLDRKQELIDIIEEFEPENYIMEQENHEQALSQLKELMKKIKNLDDVNGKQLREKKDRLSEEMRVFNKKQKGREGYLSGNNYEAKFIDKRS